MSRLIRALIGLFVLLQYVVACAGPLPGNAILILPKDQAGPHLHPEAYAHGDWIRWPEREKPELLLDLPSLWTGIAWSQAPPIPSASHAPKMIQDHPGAFRSLLPDHGDLPVWIGQAESWEDVASVRRRVSGRLLVIEYPPEKEGGISRFWRYGDGWNGGYPIGKAGVPGLLGAGEVLGYLADPAQLPSTEEGTDRWGGARRWFDHVRYDGPIVLFIITAILAYVVVCAASMLSKEEVGRLAAGLIRMSFLLPPAALLSTEIERSTTWGFGGLGFLVALGLLIAGTITFHMLWSKKGEVHPFRSIALATALVLVCVNPVWSYLSPVFSRHPNHVEALWLGLVAMAWLMDPESPRSFAWLGVVPMLVRDPSEVWPLIPVVALAFAAKNWRIVGAAFLGLALVGGAVTGWVSQPIGLVSSASELPKINVQEFLVTLYGPALWVVGGMFGFLWLLHDAYARVKLARVIRTRPVAGRLFRASLCFLLLSPVQPGLVHAAIGLFVAACAISLHEGLLL